ncbi:MAG: leucine-rich repeat domain-containing protein [Clostridiales bacterium]|nr:leucine-rich repeat domain-containing protein [Clostridiales bacterium]
MKKITKIMFAMLLCFCIIFAFVACKDPNSQETEIPGEEQEQQDDNNQSKDDLISAYQNYKDEEVEYSLYFKTDGNGKITSLSDYAIENKENIIQLEIPEKIGDEEINAFSLNLCDLPYLRILIIPDNVELIEDSGYFPTFLVIYCEKKSKFEGWPDAWDEYLEYEDGIQHLAVIWDYKNNDVATDGKMYCKAQNGMIYALKDNRAELVFSGLNDVENLELQSSVKYKSNAYSLSGIFNFAFASADISEDQWVQNNKNLKSVKLPSSMTSIGNYAFIYCQHLENVFIPESITSISGAAFLGCISLTSIEIPSSVTSIDESAFSACGLTSIVIPRSVTSLGERVFSECNSLESIKVDVNNKTYKSEGNCIIEKATNELIVGCKNSVIPNYVTSISDYAFYYCKSLTSIEIPSNVTSIGRYAFSGCNNLTSATVPTIALSYLPKNKLKTVRINGGTHIDRKAFSYCSSLESVFIPKSVTSIDAFAFISCNNLKIYCEAESQPSGWDEDWNDEGFSVEWGYKADRE